MLNLQQKENNFYFYDDDSKRIFKLNFPKKINIHGLGKYNAKELLYEEIIKNNYIYKITETELILYFNLITRLHNKEKKNEYELVCDEFFEDYTEILKEDLDKAELRRIIKNMNNQIKNLNAMVNNLKNEIKEKEEREMEEAYNSS